MAENRRFQLTVIRGANPGKIFPLERGANLIGRWDPDKGAFPEVDLDAEDVDAKVSRKHAIIEIGASKITLEDVGSLNGTYINRGERIEAGIKHKLLPGDEVVVGKIFMKLEETEDTLIGEELD